LTGHDAIVDEYMAKKSIVNKIPKSAKNIVDKAIEKMTALAEARNRIDNIV
jgi:hypothetical protein